MVDGWEGGKHHAPAALSPGMTWYLLRLGGLQGWFGWVWKLLPPMGFNPQTVQLVASCYTDYAVPAHKGSLDWRETYVTFGWIQQKIFSTSVHSVVEIGNGLLAATHGRKHAQSVVTMLKQIISRWQEQCCKHESHNEHSTVQFAILWFSYFLTLRLTNPQKLQQRWL